MNRLKNGALLISLALSLFVVTGLFLHIPPASAQTGKALQLFLEANQAYEKGDYPAAASLYEEILSRGMHSGMVYYNLGNCFVKMGRMGEALLNYRRAERLVPRDGDLRFNLRYVLDQRKDRIEPKERIPFARAFFFWYYWLNLKEILILFIMTNLILWYVSLVLLYRENALLRWVRVLGLCLFLIAGGTLGIKIYTQQVIRQGIVVTPEANVRSGNGSDHSLLFILHEAAECRVSEEDAGWMKIELPDGKIGWIDAESIKII